MQPLASIIIPTYNRNRLLQKCLESIFTLAGHPASYEVIVVDDSSSDDTARLCQDFIKSNPDAMRYYCLSTNKGPGAARNYALNRANGQIIIFLDDDCQVSKEWFSKLIVSFEKNPHISAVGGGIINPSSEPLAWASYILEFSSWFPRGGKKIVKNIPTCNIAYRANDIRDMRFRELRNAGYEDTLFNYGLRLKGKTILFDPSITVIHNKWDYSYTYASFLRSQIIFAKGFINGGYRAHGFWGHLIMRFRWPTWTCYRLLFVCCRCFKTKEYLLKFIMNIGLIVKGEYVRNRVICKSMI